MIAIICIGLSGCNKDADVDAFIVDLNAATNEIVETIDAAPTAAGVGEAQKAFDAKKPELKSKWNGIKGAIGLQLSFGKRKEIEDSVANNVTALNEISTKHAAELAKDEEASAKFKALLADYQSVFEPSK